MNSLEENLELLDGAGFADEYRKRSNLLGRRVAVTQNDKTFRADCIDIDDLGRLLVRPVGGDGVTALCSGSVKLVD
jgi:biotin-(acetyl-CoA carboxylase) ligase